MAAATGLRRPMAVTDRTMRPQRCRAAVTVVVMAAVLTACSTAHRHANASAGAATPSAPTGPTSARLRAAAEAMAGARSYTFAAALAIGASTTRIAGDFQAPDRVREVITAGTGTAEVVFIGAHAYTKDPTSGRWSSSPAAATQPGRDPGAAFAVLERAEGATTTPAGITFHVPTSLAGQLLAPNSRRAVSSVEGRAVVVPGGLSHLEFSISTSAGQVRIVLDYQHLNTGAPVTAPTLV